MPKFAVSTSTGQTIEVHSDSEDGAKRHVDKLSLTDGKATGTKVTGTAVAAVKLKD